MSESQRHDSEDPVQQALYELRTFERVGAATSRAMIAEIERLQADLDSTVMLEMEIERLRAELNEALAALPQAARAGQREARKQERERCIEEVKMAMYGDDTRCEWNLALEHVVDVLSALEDE